MWPPTDAQVATVETQIDDWKWQQDSSAYHNHVQCHISLNSFWSVRRHTAKALEQSNTVFFSSYKKRQSFNSSLQKIKITNVCVSIVNDAPVNLTRVVEVPFMTNHIAVEEGEESLMETREERAVGKAQPKKPAAKTWKYIEQSKKSKPKKRKQYNMQSQRWRMRSFLSGQQLRPVLSGQQLRSITYQKTRRRSWGQGRRMM